MTRSAPRRAAPHPRVLRRRTGAAVAGVAGGVADHLGVEVFRVRLVLAALCALGGAGVLAYAALWMFCPLEPAPGPERAVGDRERWQAVGLVGLALGLAVLFSAAGDGFVGWVVGPLGVVLVGAAVVWREADTADEVERGRSLRATFAPRALVAGGGGVLRALLGTTLVAGGIVAFLLGSLDVGQLQFGLLAALATLVGVAVLTVPWWLRLVRELTAERRARIRGQERAEIAAHLHDSVLQTLALIQKQCGEDEHGREVRRLARRQERELRSWLHGRAAPGDDGVRLEEAPATVAAALTSTAAEVEDDHGVRVAPVVVGDAPLTEAGVALVAAAREAMVNAAKHAGVTEISVYAEAQADELAVFVRDRGVGFDPATVPADRQGLAGSVHARMARHGGTVRLRTVVGEGTEVGLTVPQTSGAPQAPHAPLAAPTEGER